MNDQRNKLQTLFQGSHRYANFGDVIVKMHVSGFRCHQNTLIEVNSPITAFCGLNGTGKSTLIQLAASAYKNTSDYYRYYIKNFIIAGKLDANPFTAMASVRYEYLQHGGSGDGEQTRSLTVSRGMSRWAGYKRQPTRRVYFVGMGFYLPRIEELDFATRYADTLVVQTAKELSDDIKGHISTILGSSYDSARENYCKVRDRTQKVVTVGRGGAIYSEANMGCGEGRIYNIVRVLEGLPDRSLILLEEPEVSLHQSAQYNFGRYLVDVCVRKRHQVFLTTHSEPLLKALPAASRMYIERMTSGGARIIPGITASEAASLMAAGKDKALHVLVEDDVATGVLQEIVRKTDPTFLRTIEIHPSGDTNAIQNMMKVLGGIGLPVAAVRDGDKNGDPKSNIFKLPGSMPPEKELLNNVAVRNVFRDHYGIDVSEFLSTEAGAEHHEWFEKLAKNVAASRDALIQEAARAYVSSLPEPETASLTNQLKAAIRQ